MADGKVYIEDPVLQNEEMKKIYVGGIAAESKDEDLKSFFEGFEVTVTEVVVVRKDKTKKHLFGFLTLGTSAMVDELLLKREELVFSGNNLQVNRAIPKNLHSSGGQERTKKLFIANLPKTGFEDEELKQYFEDRHDPRFGTIESIQLIKRKDEQGNKTEENRGFGFILVSSEDMADKMAMQHASFEFCKRNVELKKSVPNSESGARGGGRGGGAGRGNFQSPRGRGGQHFIPPTNGYGQYNDGYGGEWGAYYGYGGGYEYQGYGGYGDTYGASPARGNRFRPY